MPLLNGLILAGGKSTRMGQDKGRMKYHGQEQRIFAWNLLKKVGIDKVCISCREEDVETLQPYHPLTDLQPGLGPIGGILAAFDYDPDSAWLVIACDLPLLDETTLNTLIKKRNTASIATAYLSPVDHRPEPLIAIWEPKAFPILKNEVKNGRVSPRMVLERENAHLISVGKSAAIKNVNTPQEANDIYNSLDLEH